LSNFAGLHKPKYGRLKYERVKNKREEKSKWVGEMMSS
jgi:hypothetical protein